MFGRITAAFRPAQNHPGLLLCDGEHRDNATRLREYERRCVDLRYRMSEMYNGQEFTAENFGEEYEWWARTAYALFVAYLRHQVGLAFQARLQANPGSSKLDAIVYELHMQNTLRNKRTMHRRLLRSIK